jgi:hypothetical protein
MSYTEQVTWPASAGLSKHSTSQARQATIGLMDVLAELTVSVSDLRWV